MEVLFIDNIKVSVIVPVYNGRKTLKRCLECLINQTLDKIEFIIVNDASFDYTLRIMTEYKDKFPDKFVLISNENNIGPGGSRNAGLAAARGEYIGFMDCDDIIEPEMFKTLYDKAVKKDSDVVISPFRAEEIGRVKFYEPNRFRKKYINPETRRWLMLNIGYLWNCIFKRSFLNTLNLFFREVFYCEDFEFLCEVYSKAEKISFVSKVFYTYKYNQYSMTHRRTVYTIEEFQDVIESLVKSIRNRCKNSKYFDDIKETLDFNLIGLTTNLLIAIIQHTDFNLKSVVSFNKIIRRCIGSKYSLNKYIRDDRYANMVSNFSLVKCYDSNSRKFYSNLKKSGIIR